MPAETLKYRLKILENNGYHLVYPHGINLGDPSEYFSGSLREPLFHGCTFRVLFYAHEMSSDTEIKIALDGVDSSTEFISIHVSNTGKVVTSGKDKGGEFNVDFGVPDVREGDYYTLAIRYENGDFYRYNEYLLDAFALDVGSFGIFEVKYTGTDGMLTISFSVPNSIDKFTTFRKTPLKPEEDFLVYIRSAPTGWLVHTSFQSRAALVLRPTNYLRISPKFSSAVITRMYLVDN
ncbi:hypothetical protein HPB50_018009 [Hyalomma asiaticum]|uniref:Uncharacterized protein n=1 Tax=Hyalomma asiaticum TaxID=266040 RepID=A0ACB7S606_HYAAI|nr:hypothetical protein HPB50_018009 [Hyalomma asiaticum]